MMDILYIGLAMVFFFGTLLLVKLCEGLITKDSGNPL